MVLAEVYSNIARRADEATARRHAARVVDDCALLAHEEGQAFEAGRLHAALRRRVRGFPLSDAFVLAAARGRDLPVLSGDPHLKGQPDVLFLG